MPQAGCSNGAGSGGGGGWFGGGTSNSTDTQICITQKDLGLPNAPTSLGSDQVGAILTGVYIVAGMAAVIIIIIGGVRYVTSNGDSSGIQSAKNTILYAVAGLVVIIAAAAITDFVIKNIAK